MTTDYVKSTGCPEPYLRRIASGGFSHVHWCHQWNTDFLYNDAEIDQIGEWMNEYGLALTDLHGSSGVEKSWGSRLEYERIAGVDLVANRLLMTARLGSDTCIMHLPSELSDAASDDADWKRFYRTLDELDPVAVRHGVRIAIENGDFDLIERVLDRYDPAYLGLCYDSGHGNLIPDGLGRLELIKDRLISVHLHDNDGESDQHKSLFSGSIDWSRLAGTIASSSYEKWVSMESAVHNAAIKNETDFLSEAFETGMRFSNLIEAAPSPQA